MHEWVATTVASVARVARAPAACAVMLDLKLGVNPLDTSIARCRTGSAGHPRILHADLSRHPDAAACS